MTDANDHFDRAVRATAAFGSLSSAVLDVRNDIAEMKADSKEVKADIKHIRSGMDRWGGVMVVVGTLVSLAASLLVAVAGKAIASSMGL